LFAGLRGDGESFAVVRLSPTKGPYAGLEWVALPGQFGQVGGGETEAGRSDVLDEVVERAGAGDGEGDRGCGEQPGRGDLCGGRLVAGGDVREGCLVNRSPTAAEREIRQVCDAVLLALREDRCVVLVGQVENGSARAATGAMDRASASRPGRSRREAAGTSFA
jgi:hypothetical protein